MIPRIVQFFLFFIFILSPLLTDLVNLMWVGNLPKIFNVDCYLVDKDLHVISRMNNSIQTSDASRIIPSRHYFQLIVIVYIPIFIRESAWYLRDIISFNERSASRDNFMEFLYDIYNFEYSAWLGSVTLLLIAAILLVHCKQVGTDADAIVLLSLLFMVCALVLSFILLTYSPFRVPLLIIVFVNFGIIFKLTLKFHSVSKKMRGWIIGIILTTGSLAISELYPYSLNERMHLIEDYAFIIGGALILNSAFTAASSLPNKPISLRSWFSSPVQKTMIEPVTKFCSQCGNQNENRALHCIECGIEFD